MLAVWNLVSKLLAPLAPVFLIFCIVLGASTWHLHEAKQGYKDQITKLNLIVSEQTEVISACREDNKTLDTVLIKTQEESAMLRDKTIKSLTKLERLSCKSTPVGGKLDAIKDEDVLNLQLGDATISLLNEATSTPSN